MYVSSHPQACGWREAKIPVPVDNDYTEMATTRDNDRISSPTISPCYGQCCKEENSIYPLYDRNFNFTAKMNGEATSEDDDYHHSSLKRKITVTRDPMSHRIIEKRRRDRMNNCLADLSRLIPQEYLKKGRGRIEKTEIIEMAIKHMKNLQAMTNNASVDTISVKGKLKSDDSHHNVRTTMGSTKSTDRYKLGYQECLSEMMRFLVEFQGLFASDTLCLELMNHLQKYYQNLTEDETQLQIISESNNLKIKAKEHRAEAHKVDRNLTTSVAVAAIHSDDSCQEGNYFNSNYYRNEVVDNSRSNLFCNASSIKRDIMSDIPSSPEPSCHYTDRLNDIPSPNGTLYKFKKYICERFEHSKTDHPSVSSTVINCRKKDFEFVDSTHSTSAAERNDCNNDPRLVPIFALHAQGSFYVPLTVDSRLLTPFLKELNNNDEVQDLSSLLLHPVTISVKFSRHAIPPTSPPLLLPSKLDDSTRNTRTGLLFVS